MRGFVICEIHRYEKFYFFLCLRYSHNFGNGWKFVFIVHMYLDSDVIEIDIPLILHCNLMHLTESVLYHLVRKWWRYSQSRWRSSRMSDYQAMTIANFLFGIISHKTSLESYYSAYGRSLILIPAYTKNWRNASHSSRTIITAHETKLGISNGYYSSV